MPITIVKADGSSLRFDAVRDVAYDPTAVATEHPVEDGGSVTDSAKRLSDTLSFVGIVTRTPFGSRAGADARDRDRQAAAFLESCLGEVVTIVGTRRGDFPRMTILRCSHTDDGIGRYAFDVSARQIRLATVSTVDAVELSPTRTRAVGLATSKDVGEQGTDETTAEDGKVATSSAASLWDKFAAKFGGK